ncbi:hypothetical protein UPYG_G00114150 [Umbra pygmaea]|uniref:Small ribosomal subunit protein mS31 n=1 Tax=Umbra pygmaea TaxID=75934 RepID=A0ABD0X3D4_UMBPY
MYRRVLLSVYQSRNRALHVYTRESCLRSSNPNITLSMSRAANGGVLKTFGTSSFTYCEKKATPPPLKDERSEVKDGRKQKESIQVAGEFALELQDNVKMKAEQSELRADVNKNAIHLSEKFEESNEKIEEIPVKTNDFDLQAKMEGVTENKITEAVPTKTESEAILEFKTSEIKDIERMEDVTIASRTGEVEQRLDATVDVANELEAITEIQVKTKDALESKMDEYEMPEGKIEKKKEEQQRIAGFPKEQIQPVKRGKESLLQLLGAMKVDVTSKRKLKALKMQRSSEAPTRPPPDVMESTISMFQEASGMADAPAQSETLSPKLVAAASAAAATLPNKSKAESELLKKLRQHEAVGEAQKNGNNIGVIISDMKVGKRHNGRQNARPANQIRFDDDGRGYTHDRGITSELDCGLRRRRSLFSGKRLSIFTPSTEPEADTDVAHPTLWDMELANQVALSANQLPRNGFQEMIQWTTEGKLWEYPINNEAGLDEEARVPFHEHVFLEKHLQEGFPRQGPIRHFMELVVSGLAKNPYYTVQQKKEHIAWFRDYFTQKEDVLKEAEIYLN